MPDPIEELSSFDPGVPVNPLPAAEVRRRGDRLRRRRTAVVVAGAAAAVALVVAPIAVLADDDDAGTPQPAPPAGLSESVLLTVDEVPARERLTEWREADQGDEVLACAPQSGPSLDAGSSVRRDFEADIAGDPNDGLPISVIRTAVLEFDADAAASDAYDTALGWVLDCPGADNGNRDADEWAVSIEGGQGEWRMRSYVAPEYCGPGGECDAVVFDRMGVAQFGDRLVLVSFAEIGGPLEPEGLDATMEQLFQAAVTKAGGEITGGSSSGSETVAPEPSALDFPLETGLPTDTDSAMEGPGPDVEGIILPEGFCGASVWPPASPAARLALTVTGPEYALWRELVTFASAGEAVAAIAGIRDAVESCPEVAGDSPADDVVFTFHPVDSGYDDATFSYSYREGLGGVVYQFVRVGHAVLATAQQGEWAPETTPEGARELNGENQQLTALMCEYTEAGC